MQAAIIRGAIRLRGVVLVLACIVVAYGVHGLVQARYDVFPEFAPPQVGVQTEAIGLTPRQVEILVTRPVELAIEGLPGIERLQSSSISGLSAVTVYFKLGTDIYRARQLVGEQLAVAARALPLAAVPTMTPLTSSTGIVLVAGLSASSQSLMRLRTLADWTIRPRLLAVPGVAAVEIFGGDVRTLQIQVDPDQLVRYRLALTDVLAAADRATGVRGAGFIDTPNQRILLRTEGQAATAAALRRTVIRRLGSGVVTLGDVARVIAAPAPAIGAGGVEGRPGVVLNVNEQYGANTLAVSRRVRAALRPLRVKLAQQGITLRSDLFRPARFIHVALSDLGVSLLLGGALVVAVLLLFLFDLRTAAISFVAIPLSLLGATLVLERLGATINTMTLSGLAIAIGEVVDDAVIGVENVVRRLRENRGLSAPRPEALVVIEACLEVRGAVVYATFAVIAVFLPVIFLSGVGGRLFAPLGLAYILAVLASLVVALTVVPALCVLLLTGRRARGSGRTQAPPVVRWTRGGYERLLGALVPRPRAASACALVVTLAACVALPLFEPSFIPDLREGHFIVHMTAVPGTSLAQSLRLGDAVSAVLLRLPEVRSVAQRVGRAALGVDTSGTNESEFEVDLRRGTSARAEDDIRAALANFVGVTLSVNSFLTERIQETLSGDAAPVAVQVTGGDLDTIDSTAAAVARVLTGVRGASGVRVTSPPGLPILTIRLRGADLERWGLDPVDVLDLVRAAYQGDVSGQVYEHNAIFDVLTLLAPTSRNSVAAVGALTLRTPDGTLISLGQVADIFEASGRSRIAHLDGLRAQSVTAEVTGRAIAGFVHDARAAVAARLHLPLGTNLRFAGSAEAAAKARGDLTLNALVAAIGVVLLLSVAMRTARRLLLVLCNLPMALAGGVLAVFALHSDLSLGAMVGFVTLFGITLRNAVLMIDHFEHLVRVERRDWTTQTAIAGAADRLPAILMTSLVTALGLLPLAIGAGTPGREVEGPMAVVILGGLLTSMLLTLLLLPTLALRFGRFEAAARR
ncbi:efflux RND transporter permease subunit [Lichenicoccus sp.]|uniref:efflux RND transporter permease subunit n=1 Tax=Lichenicoccus sp. TaxID=2781899 RepID=UPI003D0D4784